MQTICIFYSTLFTYNSFIFNTVGAVSGTLTIYELRQSKCQTLSAHSNPITAAAFSPDGKFLASYSCGENRLSFWQTSTGKTIYFNFITQFNCKFKGQNNVLDLFYINFLINK